MGSARTLAQAYRRFAEADHADPSPLYKRVALALSESDEALRAIEAASARKRGPAGDPGRAARPRPRRARPGSRRRLRRLRRRCRRRQRAAPQARRSTPCCA